MITLFENVTESLTDHEKNTLAPMLVSTLSNSRDDNRMTAKQLSGWFKASGEKVHEPRIRKLVNYLRVTNAFKPYVLIGVSNGYYLTDDIHVVDDQIESIKGRIDSMLNVVESLEAQKQNLKKLK